MSEEGLKDVYADPAHLGQVLTFLFSNASTSMPEGGDLVILTRSVKSNPGMSQSLPAGGSDDSVMLSVTFTGSATDNSSIDSVLDSNSAAGGNGAGKGRELSVVNEIVEECNGRMEVRSKAGEGTTYEIYFPCFEANGYQPGQATYRRTIGLESKLASSLIGAYQFN